MQYLMTEDIQLGKTGWLLGDLPNLLAGAVKVDVYSCRGCGKIEFFTAKEKGTGVAQQKCPNCGSMHDIDYPKCPFCKYDYINNK